MKQSTLTTKLVMLALLIGVCAYLGAAAWQSLNNPFSTVLTYEHTADDSAETTGFLVRSESVIPGESAIVDVLVSEGEKVGVGQPVAVLYRNETALARKREIRTLELQKEQQEYALVRDSTGWDNQRLDQSIIDSMIRLRSAVSTGEFSGLEDETLSLKSLVLRREYSYSGGPADVEVLLQGTQQLIDALNTAAAGDTTPVLVHQSGVFSALVDGYESVLTPAALEELTPSLLDKLANEKPPRPEGAIGKLITSSAWYFAAALPTAEAERLEEGRRVKIRFSRDWSGDVSMNVERIGPPENGRVAVIFSTNRFLSNTTLLRRQTVDIIFSSSVGIRVPKLAVRNEIKTVTDPDTGEVTQIQRLGVYTLTGAQAEFKPIRILEDDGDYYLVEAAMPENPTNNQVRTALRANDEVIVAADELYDGKVVFTH